MRLTSNWLVGLTRYPEVVARFPFLRGLSASWRVQPEKCAGCGQGAATQNFSNNINEIAKILATIPESDFDEFKRLSNTTEKITIQYMGVRGNKITVTR